MSAPSFQFKGSGWYVTDYAKGSGNVPAKGESHKSDSEKSQSESKSDGGSKTDSSSKSSGDTATEDRDQERIEAGGQQRQLQERLAAPSSFGAPGQSSGNPKVAPGSRYPDSPQSDLARCEPPRLPRIVRVGINLLMRHHRAERTRKSPGTGFIDELHMLTPAKSGAPLRCRGSSPDRRDDARRFWRRGGWRPCQPRSSWRRCAQIDGSGARQTRSLRRVGIQFM